MAVKSSIRLTGSEDVINNIRKNNSKAIQAAIDAVNNGLNIVERSMKRDCPVGDDIDTEHLKESIKIVLPAKKMKNFVRGKVGATKKTAIHVEFGTSKMLPRVFIRTQLYKCKNEVRKAARDIIKGELGL